MLVTSAMFALPAIALAPLVFLPAGSEAMNDARLLVESQVQVAATATAVLEEKKLTPTARAERLLPLAAELARLHAQRAQVDARQLEEEEARAAADPSVQRLALRLLRAMELCAASDYAGSPELKNALYRLTLAFEGCAEDAPPQGEQALHATGITEQSGAE